MPQIDQQRLAAFKVGDLVLAKYNLKGEVIWIRPLRSKSPADFFIGEINEKGFMTVMGGARVPGNAA